MHDPQNSPNRLIFSVLLVFLIINLFLPGEGNPLILYISQVVIYGFAAIYLLLAGRPGTSSQWFPAAVLFGLSLLVSQFASFNSHDSLIVSIQITSMILLAWLVSTLGVGEREIKLSMVTLVVTAAILAVIGLFQVVTFFENLPDIDLATSFLPVSRHYIEQVYTQKRIFSTFILPTTFSAFLAMSMPLAVGLALHYRSKIKILLPLLLAVVLIAVAMVQAQSNGGPVALLASAVVVLLFYLREKRIRLIPVMLGIAAAGIVLITLIGLIRGNFIWDLGAVNSPIRLRSGLWMAGLEMWSRYWLLGIGLGNFELGFFTFLGPDVRPTKHLHNSYLQLPLELGILGLAAMVLVVGMIIRSLIKRSNPTSDIPAPLHYGLMGSIVVFLVANAFEIIIYFHSVGILGAFLLGLWMRRQQPAPEDDQAVDRWLKVKKVILALGIFFAIFLLFRSFLADYFYNRVTDQLTQDFLLQREKDNVFPAGDSNWDSAERSRNLRTGGPNWEELAYYVRIAISIDGDNYRYHQLLGQILEETVAQMPAADYGPAEESYMRAITLNPLMPHLHYSRGFVLLRMGKVIEAGKEFANASRLHPTDEDYQAARRLIENRIERMKNPVTGNEDR